MPVSALDEIIERLEVMPPEERERVVKEAREVTKRMPWMPNPGFQTEAYFSEADEIGCGGEAGPGKTAFLVGMALNEHLRSLILRRKNTDVSGLVDEFEKALGGVRPQFDKYGSFQYGDRRIRLGGCQHEHDKQKYKGDPRDLIGFDQVEDFLESQYVFIIGWNRPAKREQRCRIIATMNPPTQTSGLWVFRRWGAWLDPKHPHPAKSGELRWFTSIEGEDTEVEKEWTGKDGRGRTIYPKSRTFIRGRLEENPDLAGTGYESRVAAMPAGLREAYAEGEFGASLRDAPNQTIPTSWVRLAMQRWEKRPEAHVPMCAMGVDCTGGGSDPLVLARRWDGWYDELIDVPGKDIPVERIGSYTTGVIVSYRRDHALVVIDMGGGYGGPAYEHCKTNGIDAYPYKGAEATERRSHDKKLRFVNTRSAAHWVFREALDPDQPGGSPIGLPFGDTELMADLTAPTFEVTPNGIKVEDKKSVTDRLGRSTNRGDAVIMAWWAGPKEITDALAWADQKEALARRRPMGRLPQAIMGKRAPLTGRR